MNCEHGVDIDEYDCCKCKDYMDRYWANEKKMVRECEDILKNNGYNAEVKWARKIE